MEPKKHPWRVFRGLQGPLNQHRVDQEVIAIVMGKRRSLIYGGLTSSCKCLVSNHTHRHTAGFPLLCLQLTMTVLSWFGCIPGWGVTVSHMLSGQQLCFKRKKTFETEVNCAFLNFLIRIAKLPHLFQLIEKNNKKGWCIYLVGSGRVTCFHEISFFSSCFMRFYFKT